MAKVVKCTYCDKPATRRCGDCGDPICDDHTVIVKVRDGEDRLLKAMYFCPKRLDETKEVWGIE